MKTRVTVSFVALALAACVAYNAAVRRAGAPPSSTITSAPLLVAGAKSAPVKPSPKKPAPKAQRKVIAYYFHGNFRCTTCRNIEAWSAEAIRGNFRKEIEAGRLEWRVVNTDRRGNEHFTKDYKLFTQSVVLSDTVNGRETRYKNLARVWPLASDGVALREYVRIQVAAFLKGA